MDESARLGLPYLIPNQAQKHVTVNEAFRKLDQMVQLCVQSKAISIQPEAPSDGEAYIIPASATGENWSGYAVNTIATFQDGAWAVFPALAGMRAYILDEAMMHVFNGADWVAMAGAAPSEESPVLGINTIADLSNRLSVKSDSVLLQHDDVTPGNGDCRLNVNKSAPAATASLLMQADASGRAEIGLTGDDDFHIKVSNDGSVWRDAISVDKDTGFVGIGTDAPATPFHVNAGLANVAFKLEGADPTIVFQMQDDTTTSTGNGPILFARTGDNTQFYTAGSARMTIDADGQVGIGTSSPSARLNVLAGGIVAGSPTGGDKGAGTINAEALYDDNALLSCYVLDQAIDGRVDIDKWDARTPDRHVPPAAAIARHHEPARRFVARIGGSHDPLTLDGYARHWKDKRHLTSMPNEATYDPVNGPLTMGEWIQRLVETAEIHAVLIDTLHQMLKAAEKTPKTERPG